MEIDMFNPNARAKILAPCVYLVEELCLDTALAGVMFTGELQIEIDAIDEDDWYIEYVSATNAKGVTQDYLADHPIYQAVNAVVLANPKLCDMITDECIRHAE